MALESKFASATGVKTSPAFAWAMTGVTVAAIWIGVLLSSVFAPDMVSGSQHEHLALVAGIDWIWGLVSTGIVVVAVQRAFRSGLASNAAWISLAIAMAVVWLGVVLVSAFAPVMVTGTDPTRLPLTALGAPILGTFLTWFACTLFKTSFETTTPR